MPPPLIELVSIAKTYKTGKTEVPALQDINLEIEAGEVFGVIGPSGAGKSSLLRLINLLEKPTSGRLRADALELTALNPAGLRRWRRQVGMIFQHFNLLTSKTVAENVALPLRFAGIRRGPELRERVTELLARFDLSTLAQRYPAQLSGGQKQRVGIARALACRPKILLCDEPTSALDPQTTKAVLALLNAINREFGLTIVLITHEMDVIRQVCDRVAVLDGGRCVEVGPVAEVLLHPRHPATRRLVLESEKVDETEQGKDLAQSGGPIFRLTLRGEATYEPLLGSVAQAAGVDYSILSGRIDRIKGVPYGQLTLALVGGDLSTALAQFAERGVHVERLR
ncbi:MAG TPA: methionine ABC transporter ATP-binding protein [Chthoniobacterales bacterium]